MIGWLIGLGTWKAKIGLIAGLVASLFLWLQVNNYRQRSIGAERAVANMERAADANAVKADKARKSVNAVPADKLNDQYRRD